MMSKISLYRGHLFRSVYRPLEQIRINPEDHSTYGWFAEDELATVYTGVKGLDDPEAIVVQRLSKY